MQLKNYFSKFVNIVLTYGRDKTLSNTNLIFSKLSTLRIFLIKYDVNKRRSVFNCLHENFGKFLNYSTMSKAIHFIFINLRKRTESNMAKYRVTFLKLS